MYSDGFGSRWECMLGRGTRIGWRCQVYRGKSDPTNNRTDSKAISSSEVFSCHSACPAESIYLSRRGRKGSIPNDYVETLYMTRKGRRLFDENGFPFLSMGKILPS